MSAKVYRAALKVDELMGELRRLLLMHGRADRLICRYLADLADGISEGSILLMGYGDIAELVRARLGLTLRSVRERIRVGRALRVLPALDAALISGRLTYSRVREVTRVATPADEWLWLEAAQSLSMRALERRVGAASNRTGSRRCERTPRRREPMAIRDSAGEVRLSVPSHVWALVEQAVHVVRAAFGQTLTDAEALAAVARSALAHHNASLPDRSVPLGVQVTDQPCPTPGAPREAGAGERGMTQREVEDSGTAGAERKAPHSGTEDSGTADSGQETTHCGTREGPTGEAAGREAAPGGLPEVETGDRKAIQRAGERVSPDARRLLEVLASGRSLTLGTLCDASRLSPSRAACALYELLRAGRVMRDSMGLLDVFQLPRIGVEFRRAG